LGSNGLIAYARNDESGFLHRQHYPALSVSPIDVAGAGDSLLAGVAISMLQGLTLMESAALGTCIAAIAVERVGNCPVSLGELNRLINQRNVMINER